MVHTHTHTHTHTLGWAALVTQCVNAYIKIGLH